MTSPIHARALANTRPIRRTPLLLVCLLASLPLALPLQAIAQQSASATSTGQINYDIPSGPLAPALNRFGAAAGISLQFDPALTRGLSTQGLKGSHSVDSGLAVLLQGSGLIASTQGNGVYVLEKTADDTVTLPSVRVEGVFERGAGVTEGSGSYAPSTVSIGKGQQALKDVPQSVTVISRQRMDDQALRNIDEVMDQVAGVTRTANGIYGGVYTARGLNVNKTRYDGGAARSYVTYTRFGDDDMAVFDHVEVLRGADGLFSGAGEAGGIINLSYKRPTQDFQVQGALSLGSWDNHRTEVDVSGPLALQGRVRGRLVGALQDRDFFYDYGSRRTTVLYGALEFDLNPDTLLFVGIDHQQFEEEGTNWGVPRYLDGSLLTADRSVNLAAPWSNANTERTIAFAQIEHQWNENWATQLRLEHVDNSTDHLIATLFGPINPERPMGRYWGAAWDGDIKQTSADLLVKGGFDWLNSRHDVMLGMDWARAKPHYLFSNPNFGEFTWTGIDPVVVPPQPTEKFPGGPYEVTDWTNVQHGLYGSIHLRPFERWTLITGARYVIEDKNDQYRSYPPAAPTRTLTDDGDVLVPYYGVVYAASERINVYASATEIYTSQVRSLGAPLPGTPLDPVRGSNYELGIKHELNDALVASVALYRIEKKGMAVRDPAYPNAPGDFGSSCCFYRDGYQISEGIDLELNGEVLPGWEVSAGYTWNKNENRRASNAQFSTTTPKHLLKLWSQYHFKNAWDGLALGAGVVVQSSNHKSGVDYPRNPDTNEWEPEIPYTFSQAGYAVWSARAEYKLSPKASVSVNANNLFDKHYFRSVGSGTNSNYWGEPRNVMLTLRGKW